MRRRHPDRFWLALDDEPMLWREATARPNGSNHRQTRQRIALSTLGNVRLDVLSKAATELAANTLRDIFAPGADVVHQLIVPPGVVLYEGKAVALRQFAPDCGEFADQVYTGGADQVLLLRPWQLGAHNWPYKQSKLSDPGYWPS